MNRHRWCYPVLISLICAGSVCAIGIGTTGAVKERGKELVKKEIESERITTPNAPSGVTSGIFGTYYAYSTGGSISNIGHTVEYRFSWGDYGHSSWSIGTTARNLWSSASTYIVSVEARCKDHHAAAAVSNARNVVIEPIITTVAGTGVGGYSGDGGAPNDAQLNLPTSVAMELWGNMYIADRDNHRIRKVTRETGIITTYAGTGISGYSGDGGVATSAQLNMPRGVAVDDSGNLYIADSGNNRIRKVDSGTGGHINTFAGGGGSLGEWVAATNAQLNNPGGVAMDSSGNLYIADSGTHRIRQVTAVSRIVITVAGTGLQGYGGDGGTATSAQLNMPSSVTVDRYGNLYIADVLNNCIRKVTASTGIITTVVGTGVDGFSGDGGAATSAKLYHPTDIAVDNSGNLYIADGGNNRIRRVAASTGIITTYAGTGVGGYSGDGGASTDAQLNNPSGVAIGNWLYIIDSGNHRIRELRSSQPRIVD